MFSCEFLEISRNTFLYRTSFLAASIYIGRKWILMRNLAAVLSLRPNFFEKFRRFNAIDRSIKMLKIIEFSKVSIKMKNCKHFAWPKQQVTLKKFVVKSEIFLAVLREHIIYNVKWVEFHKMSEVILNHLYFGPNLVFFGDCFRMF